MIETLKAQIIFHENVEHNPLSK